MSYNMLCLLNVLSLINYQNKDALASSPSQSYNETKYMSLIFLVNEIIFISNDDHDHKSPHF